MDALRFNHDIAKAVNSDDAGVPVELWDGAVCRHPPTIKQQQALSILRGLALRLYRLKLWRDARSFLRREHGEAWTTKARISGLAGNEDANAIQDILWHSAGNNWFKYPTGLHLIFFRFPARYCLQAKRGVRVMFSSKGPTSKRRQPPLKPEEKEVLRKKIIKFVERNYIAPLSGKIMSLIKCFAVPKGTDDWRIVFHARANKLNNCVWTPSFCLPTVNSLLHITDESTLMQDMDVGKMFLNFQLHPNTMRFAAVDLGPLDFTTDECPHRWMCWTRNLMGFRSSPYNSIKMYLIAEEIICGDRRDPTNAFQWDTI